VGDIVRSTLFFPLWLRRPCLYIALSRGRSYGHITMLALEHPTLIYASSPPHPPSIPRREPSRRLAPSPVTVPPPPRSHPSASHSQPPSAHSTVPSASSSTTSSLPSTALQVRHVPHHNRHSSPPPRSPSVFSIHEYPSQDLLRLLAALLKQIVDANDELPKPPTSPVLSQISHAALDRYSHSSIWPSLTLASRTALTSSPPYLSFHARTAPTITLESYLLRILKYCPTTNEVFVSLLVYFDRMAKLAKESTGNEFIIDSCNIHRLVIAGVTVASKFFSDVFYTNSRYAKA
jgi:PHO85 cyclin-6/7